MKKKIDIVGLILDLQVRKERLEKDFQQARDEMYEAQGAAGEIECLIYKLEEMK